MLRSATFTLGILLAGLAFVGFLLLGGVMAPPPYSVVIAVQDIPAYSVLDSGALGVDAQRINNQVAHSLILRDEIDAYVGGFVIQNIHAGEPLRKSAIVATDNPEAASRLALAMTDPDKVAMVIPVDAKTAPGQIMPTDWVDLVVGLAPGNISAGSSTTFANMLSPTPLALALPAAPSFGPTPSVALRANPTPVLSANAAMTSTGVVAAGEMNLPADKVVIQNVPVLAVRFQQVPNPTFTGSGGSFGQTSSSPGMSPPAYIQGDIQSVTVLIPRSSVELVTFGADNGRVHLVLLPAQTAQQANGAQSPTFGVTFNDVLAWMMRERSLATNGQAATNSSPTGLPSQPTPNALPPTPSTGAAQPRPPVDPTPAPATAQPKPTVAPATISTGLDFGAILVPLVCGVVLLVLAVAVVRFIRTRRREKGLAG